MLPSGELLGINTYSAGEGLAFAISEVTIRERLRSSCQILWKFPSRLIADQSAAVAIP